MVEAAAAVAEPAAAVAEQQAPTMAEAAEQPAAEAAAHTAEAAPVPKKRRPSGSWAETLADERWLLFALAVAVYFLLMSGTVANLVSDAAWMGAVKTRTGEERTELFKTGGLSEQHAAEGYFAGLMFTTGAMGFVLLDWGTDPSADSPTRMLHMFAGGVMIILCYNLTMLLLKVKVPDYMN